jgi:hypothetical protein
VVIDAFLCTVPALGLCPQKVYGQRPMVAGIGFRNCEQRPQATPQGAAPAYLIARTGNLRRLRFAPFFATLPLDELVSSESRAIQYFQVQI